MQHKTFRFAARARDTSVTDTSAPWGQRLETAPVAAPQPDLIPSRVVYDGKLSELYGIYLRHLTLMVLTLGWSRFWGRTRLRRYLWNHVAILGDRFEYRGRGIELLIGFVLVLIVLALWAGIMWLFWVHILHGRALPGMGFLNVYFISVALIGLPLAFVGQYAALRYRLSRTRWRGIRCGLAGSAWRYGALASLLTLANAVMAQLLTPVVSVSLARPRISNAHLGTQRLEFVGTAGDVYGRFVGYYFLNIMAFIAVFAIGAGALAGVFAGVGFSAAELKNLGDLGRLRIALFVAALLVGMYVLFGLIILPLRCWWQAYLLRYLVARTRAGQVLFASSISTRQMWGFLVLNYLIVILTVGLGWPWVMHRTLRLIARELWIYGAPDGSAIVQPPERAPRFGEGLLDMFDVTGF
jgi:uncharacterized membrane protein YjgN (DUF898 family)